jgi:hypothetical protein
MSEIRNDFRNPSLDGVRAIACISVFCVHIMQLHHLDDRLSLISLRRLFPFYLLDHAILCTTILCLEKFNIELNGRIRNMFVFLFAFVMSLALAFLLARMNKMVLPHEARVPHGSGKSRNQKNIE